MNLFHEAKKVLDKDGKVNALGPYGKQKLTGREIQTYFRRNKVKDKVVKKAVEVALDLGGAMDIAIKAIKDYYGDKILKAKEVQTALKFANEESFRDSFDMLDEDYKKVIKMYPRDRDWKKLITKHKRAIDALRNNEKDLPKKVEDELLTWASQTGEVGSKDDAEDFIMSIIDEGTLSEGKNLMPDIQKIVDTKGAKKVGGIMVDMFTASMINQIYNKVNDQNKKKMEKSNISTLVDLAQRMMQKMGDNLGEGAVSAAQRAAIAISKKEKAGKPGYDKEGKSLKKESVMNVYRQMWRDASDIVEVTDKEINAMKQLSKDAEKIKKNYQKIVNMGDKELKNTKYNKEYEDILKMSQSVLSLIGKLQTQKIINKESLEEKLSKADLKMIDQMYDKKGNLTDVGKAVMNYKPGDNIQKILQKLNKK